MKTWFAFLVLFATVLAGSAQAQPEAQTEPGDDEAARGRFQAGLAFYEAGRYEEALPEFEAAWELSQRPEMLINIANAAERALSYGQAATVLEEYLERVPDADNANVLRGRISRNRAAAERLAAREAEGEEEEEEEDQDQGDAPDSADSGSGTRLAGWVTIGGAAALGIGSLITGLVSHGTYTDLEEVCSPACPPDRAGDIDRGRSLANASTVLSALTLAAAVAGVVLVVVGRDSGEEDDQAVEVMAGLTGASVRVRY